MCQRCKWVNPNSELCKQYHDDEWGVPVYDDRKLFEMLTLEGAQAGLSWETVLNKREKYRKSFYGFDINKISNINDGYIKTLMLDAGIIRNGLKIKSVVSNAKVFIQIQKEYGSFSAYIWKYVNNKPINGKYKTINLMPTKDELSDLISKELKKQGMSFVGSTIIYAFMQAVGMINAHTTDCYRYKEIEKMNLWESGQKMLQTDNAAGE